ncbi:hypothetical protein Phi4:1_gp108 [Cellulophaga phage phi4:1]|uniref:Lipoprotein n=3 Tax=Lightbulbvirus Cba41 TaxID=1918524 RepID=A0A0S2MWN6_9CAUD|nr:hypothetical protein Phi4:1_gp108 [Cellulophaga phage phi4:1]AGO49521.1 hypothetical protein Phi4:1_gp108 [Cellulophaga phage phi4:1]ALO80117.1 hypothetical protein Phi4113_108 [Cellulophaga phage phi4:1_13]ALO80314.1 hypothetical protein Phi4118_108 [Cellulophaga phage phi4:1_18]
MEIKNKIMKTLLTILTILMLLSCGKHETQYEELNMSFTVPTFLDKCGEPVEAILVINGVLHQSKLNAISGGWKMDGILVEDGKSTITKLVLIDKQGTELYTAVGYMDRYRFDLINDSNPMRVSRYTKIGVGVAVICL